MIDERRLMIENRDGTPGGAKFKNHQSSLIDHQFSAIFPVVICGGVRTRYSGSA